MPGKLDVAAGGYLQKGEPATPEARKTGTMRELEEELGLKVEESRLKFLTRRLNVSLSSKGNERKSCCDIFYLDIEDDKVQIDPVELEAYYWIPFDILTALQIGEQETAKVDRVDVEGDVQNVEVSMESFCSNFDDYLFVTPALIKGRLASEV